MQTYNVFYLVGDDTATLSFDAEKCIQFVGKIMVLACNMYERCLQKIRNCAIFLDDFMTGRRSVNFSNLLHVKG